MHHGVHNESRNDGAIRIGANHTRRNDLFDHRDHALRRKGRLLLTAEEAPHLHVPLFVGALRMDDRHVWIQWRHRPDLPVAVGALHLTNQRIHLRQVAL